MEDYDADGVMKLYGVTPTEFIDMKGQTDCKPKTEKTKKKSEVEVPGE